MSMPIPHADHGRLKKRADYFFASSAYARDEVHDFANALKQLGPTVTIGGFLRDLCLGGLRKFKSDVDFVVDPASARDFDRFVATRGAERNRFGGYGLRLGKWKVDVWPLERTWAAEAGHVAVTAPEDLLKATFFDWDAILYSVADRRLIHGPHYFDRLRTRVLDINLEPNPNPLGNAVRALRYACRWHADLSERLAEHVARQIRDSGWSGLVASENRSFSHPILHQLDPDPVTKRFSRLVGGPVALFEHYQGELFLFGPSDSTTEGPMAGDERRVRITDRCTVICRTKQANRRRRPCSSKKGTDANQHTLGVGYPFG